MSKINEFMWIDNEISMLDELEEIEEVEKNLYLHFDIEPFSEDEIYLLSDEFEEEDEDEIY